MQLIHSDLVGPVQTPSLVGSRYFVVFIDKFSRKSCVYFIKNKSETFGKFREFKSRIGSKTCKKILMLQTDMGGKYLLHEVNNFLTNHGIVRQLTMARTPQKNGVSERWNKTLVERARSMLAVYQLLGFLIPRLGI